MGTDIATGEVILTEHFFCDNVVCVLTITLVLNFDI